MSRIVQNSFNFTAVNQAGPWLYHDRYEAPFSLSIAFYLGTGLAGTFSIQQAFDDFGAGGNRIVSASQTTTTITVTDQGYSGGNGTHGLAVGDVVRLIGYPGAPGGLGDGQDYPVASITNAQTYTLTSTVSQTVAQTNFTAQSARVFAPATTLVPVAFTGLTARAVLYSGVPAFASRILCTAFTTGGFGYLVATQGSAGS